MQQAELQAELQAEDFLSQILLGGSKVNEGSSKVNDELESLQEHAQRMQRVEQNEEEHDFRINNVIDPARDSNKKLTQIQPQHDPGIPNSSIIIHGLNYATTQESLYLALKESGAKVDSVRLVLDKPTLKSRGFAFCHFYSERFAMEFVTAQVSQGGFILDDFITRIEYCRERSGGGGLEERADWHCFECASKNFEKRVFCFRCGLEKSASDEKTKEVEEMDKVNGGVRDIGSVPFPILLFRELDPLTTEDAIWQNTLLVCKPTSIWLVKDRKSRRSLGHCFISFPSIEMANKLLNKMFKGKEPKPFYIENKMIQVSYAHMGSFIPSPKPSPFACFYEENVIGSPGVYSSYWDSSAFCRPFPHDQVDSRIPPLPSKEDYLASLQAAELEKEELKKAVLAKELKKKKHGVVSLKMSRQMQKWSEKKKEMGDLDELMEKIDDIDTIPDSLLAKKISSVNALNDEFSDLARIACLLPGCRRKFTSIQHLSRHQKESPYHAQRMRLYQRHLIFELRQAMNQGKPGGQGKKSHLLLHSTAQTISRKVEKVVVTEQPTRHGIKSDNIGNQMLQKLGWQTGTGLGKKGEGIVNPVKIQVNGLKKGLGLIPRSIQKK